MYELLKFFGFFIRQFLMPNPFESSFPEHAEVVNLLFGIILIPVSYFIVGRFYDRHRDGAAIGSLMFNIVYIAVTFAIWGLLALLNWISDKWIAVLICTSAVVVMIVIGFIIFKSKKSSTAKKVQNENILI